MKLKLIKPKVKRNVHLLDTYYYDILKNKTFYIAPPLPLAIVASLTPKDVEVSIVDENIEYIDFNEDVDLVGITITSMTAPRGYEIADLFRSKNIPVILGGLHVRLMPKQALKHADAIVIGEAEGIWGRVINDFKRKRLKKVYKPKSRCDLTNLPLPRWDLIKNEKYSCATVMMTRGCPHNCEFCVVGKHFGNKIRKRPVRDVIKEIALLKKHYDRFWFIDYNLFFDKAYAKELLTALIPLKISYICFANIYLYKDDGLLSLMAESGCKYVSIGFETTDPNGLRLINKEGINRIEEYSRAIEKIQSYGIRVKPQFIVGFDYNQSGVFDDIESFVNNNDIIFPDIYIAGVFYGTDHFNRLKKEGKIDMDYYSSKSSGYCMLDTGRMSSYDTLFKTAEIYKRLYSYNALFRRIENFYDNHKEQIEQQLNGEQLILRIKFSALKVKLTLLCLARIKELRKLAFMLKLIWHPKSVYKGKNLTAISYNLSDIERRTIFLHPLFFESYLACKMYQEYSKNPTRRETLRNQSSDAPRKDILLK